MHITFQVTLHDGYADIQTDYPLSTNPSNRYLRSTEDTTEDDSRLLRRLTEQFLARTSWLRVKGIQLVNDSDYTWTLRVVTDGRPTKGWVKSRLRNACLMTGKRAQITSMQTVG